MALITTIPSLMGDFKVKFSTKTKKFSLEPPKSVKESENDIKLKTTDTYDQILEEIKRVTDIFLIKESFIRKVIMIQLQTSESNYITKPNPSFSHEEKSDFLESSSGNVNGFRYKRLRLIRDNKR
jgi:hypothetical protein